MFNLVKNFIENLFNVKISKKENSGINIESSNVSGPVINGDNNTAIGNHNVSGKANVVMGPTRRDVCGDNNVFIG